MAGQYVYLCSVAGGHGIKTMLSSRVLDKAKGLGFQTVFLFTPDRESYYVRRGWKVLDHTIYRNQEVTIMQRDFYRDLEESLFEKAAQGIQPYPSTLFEFVMENDKVTSLKQRDPSGEYISEPR